MVKLVPFKVDVADALNQIGLSYGAMARIFLGPPNAAGPGVPRDAPGWASFFIAREFNACEAELRGATNATPFAPDPITNEIAGLDYSFIGGKLVGYTLPVFRVFGTSEIQFCLVYASLMSRVTHVIVPRLDCVVHDLDAANAQAVWDLFHAYTRPRQVWAERRYLVGLVDMVTSFAHQAMNHLSGLQRLIDTGLADSVDEVWVCGTEFFGPTEDVFPELASKITHLSRGQATRRTNDSPIEVFKLGSNFLSRPLHDRLMRVPSASHHSHRQSQQRFPLLAITVRCQNRRCVNLPVVVEQIVSGLLPKYPNLAVVLDGWVFPQTAMVACSNVATAVSGAFYEKLRAESSLCQEIENRLPEGTLVSNGSGESMLQSLDSIQDIDIYFSHVGTLQHKLGWFTRARGVVHGPRTELTRMEASYYSAETASAPVFLMPDNVEDIIPDASTNSKLLDYRIINVAPVIHALDRLVRESRAAPAVQRHIPAAIDVG